LGVVLRCGEGGLAGAENLIVVGDGRLAQQRR
jgi:hypothetical protein